MKSDKVEPIVAIRNSAIELLCRRSLRDYSVNVLLETLHQRLEEVHSLRTDPDLESIRKSLERRWPNWRKRWELALSIVNSLDWSRHQGSIETLLVIMAEDVVMAGECTLKTFLPEMAYEWCMPCP